MACYPRSVISTAVVLIWFSASSLLASTASDGWFGYRGSEATGHASTGLPPGNGPLGFELSWKRPLGSDYAGVSVSGDRLVTGYGDGARDRIVALDVGSGDELWSYDLGPMYAGHDGSHDGPIATPMIAEGRVFALGAYGDLAALDLASGEEIWKVHLDDDLGHKPPFYGFAASPLVADGVLVLPVGDEKGVVFGFDPANGEVLWQAGEDEFVAQSPIWTELAGRRQVVVLGGANVFGLVPKDGTVLWTYRHEGGNGAMGAMTSSPLPVGKDQLFLKHDNDNSSLLSIAAGEGVLIPTRVHESNSLSKSYSPPAAADGVVYGYTSRFLGAVDVDSGELLWRSRQPGDGFLAVVEDQLIVLTKEGRLHLAPASTEGWSESARLELFSDLAWTPPSFSGGSLYVRSLGEIARVDLVRAAAGPVVAETALPAALERLSKKVAAASDSGAVVDRFLADRQLPLVDGETATFLWRGEAEDVGIAGEMIGARREEPMHRLAGTDLWWWQTELDRRARVSYLFFVDGAPQVDSQVAGRTPSTVLGADMNWNRGEPLEMSWFAMPDWPGAVSAVETIAETTTAAGRTEEIELSFDLPDGEEGDPETVPVTVWLPPGYDDTGEQRYPVVFVHDRYAATLGGWPETLDRVIGESVAPLIAVMVEGRLSGYGERFADTVAAAIDDRYRTRPERDSRANVGFGFGAGAATQVTLAHPESFGRLGVQSFYGLTQGFAALENAITEVDASSAPLEVYLEWGRWDLRSPHEGWDMRENSRRVWELFVQNGWQPTGGEMWGGTDWGSWKHRTGLLLETLFPQVDGANAEGLSVWRAAEL